MPQEVVITGLGIVCPLGVGNEAVWAAIEAGRSGVRTIERFAEAGLQPPIGGEVTDLDPKQYVKPRKSLKVMSRETHFGFSAAEIAWSDAGLEDTEIPSERLGVVVGANIFRSDLNELVASYRASSDGDSFDFSRWGQAGMPELYPLWMLKYLPNMTACHIGIFHDARGPINTIVEGDVSSLLSVIEAADVIARGHADVMIAGATSSMLSLIDLCWHAGSGLSTRTDDPAGACRPFDADRDGTVASEGAGMFVLESREHAEKRGARIRGRIASYARRAEPSAMTQKPTGAAVRNALATAVERSGIAPEAVGHVSAHGLGAVEADAFEAKAISEVLGDVPVTATKSFFGNLGAAGGAAELVVSLLGAEAGVAPPTQNYATPDPACPVRVSGEPIETPNKSVVAISHKCTGQAVALVVDEAG